MQEVIDLAKYHRVHIMITPKEPQKEEGFLLEYFYVREDDFEKKTINSTIVLILFRMTTLSLWTSICFWRNQSPSFEFFHL